VNETMELVDALEKHGENWEEIVKVKIKYIKKGV
jgi:hypothetical protein